MKPTELKGFSPSGQIISLLLFCILACTTLLMMGCEPIFYSKGIKKKLDSLTIKLDYLGLQLDSLSHQIVALENEDPASPLKRKTPCQVLFPDSLAATYDLILDGTGTGTYDIARNDSCHYDLSAVSDDCECKWTIERLTFSNPDLEGEVIDYEFIGSSTSNFAIYGDTIKNGQVSMADYDWVLEWQEGLKVRIVSLESETAIQGLGLCVVVDIEGGGL